jgi:DNA-binding Xre family transcriptional regulator
MRKDRDWTQGDLATATGMAQSRISLLEDPSYERMSLTTLKRIASAFDVALMVRFVPFSEILRRAADDNEGHLSVVSFADDSAPALPSPEWNASATVHIGDGSDLIIRTVSGGVREYRLTIPQSEDTISAYAH